MDAAAADVTFQWLGAAGVAIACHGRCIVVDPYFSRLPLWRLVTVRPRPDDARVAMAWHGLPAPVCAIAVGHTHIDHALDLPALACRTEAPVFGCSSLAALCARAGLPGRVTVCHPGKAYPLPGLGSLAVVAGTHGGVLLNRPPLMGTIDPAGCWPLRAREYRCGDVLFFDLMVGGRRLVHAGSAGQPTSAGLEGSCDVLFLCVPGWRAAPDYPGELLRRLRPRRIVPIHFDRLSRALDDPRGLKPDALAARLIDLPGFMERLRAAAPETPVCVPRPGESLAV